MLVLSFLASFEDGILTLGAASMGIGNQWVGLRRCFVSRNGWPPDFGV